MKNRILSFVGAFLLIACFFSLQTAFAGQAGSNCPPTPAPCRIDCGRPQLRQFAAAQTRYEQNQPPGAGLTGEDSAARSRFSFLWTLLIVLGGIWSLCALLRSRFDALLSRRTRAERAPKVYGYVFQPTLALTCLGLLFVASIVSSLLTAPVTVSAEKRETHDKQKMTGFQNPSNKSVFKSAQQIGGTNGITQIGAPVFDAAGNRYVRGGFTDDLTIGATTLAATRDFDLFVAKYDANGAPLWARQGTGASAGVPDQLANEGATALAVDADGNVYVGGSFVKRLTLQGGANPSVTLTDSGGAGVNYESFIAKYDANGNLLWARGGNSGSPQNADNLEVGQNAVNEIVFDASGNPFIAGFAAGANVFGSPASIGGQTDILLAKLDKTNGAILWKQVIGGTTDDNAMDLKIDSAGNLYLFGSFGSPTITFPTNPPTTFTNPDDPNDPREYSTDAFVAKFDASGANFWTEDIGNADVLIGSEIAISGAGEIYLTGYYFDSATFGSTTLTESEGGSGEYDEASLGGYLAKMNSNGDFLWAKGFGGLGKTLALDAAGRVYVAGTFYDGGTFGAETPNAETLASFGGDDLFVARYDANGNFDWAKPIGARGLEGKIAVGNPSAADGKTENNYSPLGIAYNPARGTMFVSGDFQRVASLDCLTLTAPAASRQSYVTELSQDNEAVSCRIWNGLDADDNNFDSPDNWNGGILPSDGDSVYVPYTGNNFDAPTFNPATNIILNNLTVADDRVLTLERDLVLTGKLSLLGGFINAEANDRLVDLTETATTYRIADADGNGGYVIGKIRKSFASTNPFTFIVGTANGYSPVDVAPRGGTGANLTINAVQQAHPNAPNAQNRLNRYWTITKSGKGTITADLTFHYLQADVAGNESTLKLFKIEPPAAPELQSAVIDTTANTAAVSNVSEFSDWTLSALAPTAALVSVGGRITTGSGAPVSRAMVVLTDANGATRIASSNSFGFYRFTDVAVGQTYVVSVRHKRYRFAAQIVTVNDAVENLDFSPQ